MRVCVCVDGTSISENAFDYYHRHMSEPSNEYVFVHIIKQPKLGMGGKGPGALVGVLKQLQETEDDAKMIQESFETHVYVNCPENIKTIAFIIKPGTETPGKQIIEAASELQCEMIISGTRGLDEKQKAKLGSTSDYLAKNSPIPVVILPKAEVEVEACP